jgi:hypothetical protein
MQIYVHADTPINHLYCPTQHTATLNAMGLWGSLHRIREHGTSTFGDPYFIAAPGIHGRQSPEKAEPFI